MPLRSLVSNVRLEGPRISDLNCQPRVRYACGRAGPGMVLNTLPGGNRSSCPELLRWAHALVPGKRLVLTTLDAYWDSI